MRVWVGAKEYLDGCFSLTKCSALTVELFGWLECLDRGEIYLCSVIIFFLFSNADNASAKRGLHAAVRLPVFQFLPSNAISNATKYYPSQNSQIPSPRSIDLL